VNPAVFRQLDAGQVWHAREVDQRRNAAAHAALEFEDEIGRPGHDPAGGPGVGQGLKRISQGRRGEITLPHRVLSEMKWIQTTRSISVT